jgi:hypothetical protein
MDLFPYLHSLEASLLAIAGPIRTSFPAKIAHVRSVLI